MSDALWWLLQPSGLALAALAAAWLLGSLGARRPAAALVGAVVAGWLAVVALPVDAWLAAPLERRHPLPEALPDTVDGILVLGGSVEWRASVQRGQLALGASGERMIAGAALARRYPDALLAFTGVTAEALSHDLTDRPDARSLLFGDAFAERDPLILSEAASTYEEALLALQRLQPRPGETWLLVTSAWHMPRAWATFRTLGWSLVPYPVDPLAAGARWGFDGWTPAAERLARVDRIVREWGAVWVYRRTGRIAPEAWEDVAPSPAAGSARAGG